MATATLWAVGIGLVVWSGNFHGLVDHRLDPASLPYEWRGVLFVSMQISIESLGLYGLLFRAEAWSELRRTVVALGLFLAFAACGVMTMFTDMPGWFYVNTWWLLIVLLLLAARLIAAGTRALAARMRA